MSMELAKAQICRILYLEEGFLKDVSCYRKKRYFNFMNLVFSDNFGYFKYSNKYYMTPKLQY